MQDMANGKCLQVVKFSMTGCACPEIFTNGFVEIDSGNCETINYMYLMSNYDDDIQ